MANGDGLLLGVSVRLFVLFIMRQIILCTYVPMYLCTYA